LAVAALPVLSVLFLEYFWEFRDDSPSRGAISSSKGEFGDGYDRVEYLDQNWSQRESSWFYEVNQGSDLLPYDFFLSLTSAGQDEPLRSDANFRRWRYLRQVASAANPDALPVGFAQDPYEGRRYLGLTCAACHTAQIDYRGVALRIDGGPSMADMQTFLRDLVASIAATAKVDASGACTDDVCKRFVARVLALGDYKTEKEVTRDLLATQERLVVDQMANNGPGDTQETPYGYARLDAFGRIYNRVLDRVVQRDDLAGILPDVFDSDELPGVQQALKPVLEGSQDDEVVERAFPLLTKDQQKKLIKGFFNPSTAPVSYPFLWDTPQHDYVQWNGIVSNSDLGPIGRNAGEVIGVFATLNWRRENGISLSSVLSGQGFSGQHVRYESSVYVHNLRRIEALITKLWSPKWPEKVLGTINPGSEYNGKILFERYCVSCHAEIDRKSPQRRVVASMTKFSEANTDPAMAANSVRDSGYSGMLRNQYVEFAVGSLLIDRRAPVAALLTQATHGLIAEPYPNANIFRRVADWVSDLATALFTNNIKLSIKAGNYDPDTTAVPFSSLLAYKARALNGVWATAPYLHNGSVPTLYDLLLPKRVKGDPDGEQYRPDTFVVGSREFDPVKVGFISQGYDGSVFDTSLPGNSNAGHEYGTIHDVCVKSAQVRPTTADDPPGNSDAGQEHGAIRDECVKSARVKPMTADERRDLLEYLKAE
jgi:cytochrome c5